ncbi:cation/H(+) antiporter 15-like isoform X2 [Carica papaya]|uniref:cation/H(+) antiporter 15-like isoform X2 n=1 Tax=Carica papaya TaxID=3649 RepID=UPI000B8CC782|nr:cation/H(+) antiporter 15-like isoform X2 [Carica papaya]
MCWYICTVIILFSLILSVVLILRPLNQPRFVSDVLGGIVLGPSVFGQNQVYMSKMFPPEELGLFNTMSVVGMVYFIFITTLKMDTTILLKKAKNCWIISLSCLAIPYTLIAVLTSKLHSELGFIGPPFNFFLAAGLTMPHPSSVVYSMEELNLSTSELGQTALACAVLCQLFGFLFLVFSLIIEQKSSKNSYKTALSLVGFILFTRYIVRPAVEWIIRVTPEGKPVKRVYVVAVLLGTLVMSLISDLIGVSYITGAFLLGLVVPNGPPLGTTVIEKSELMIMEFFQPLLFVRMGYLMDFTTIKDWRTFTTLQFIVLIGYAGKIFGICMYSYLSSSCNLRSAFLLGLVLNIRGSIDLIFFIRWQIRKFIDEPSYSSFVLSALAVNGIVTPLIKMLYNPSLRLYSSASLRQATRSLQTTRSTGELRILACVHSEDDVHGIISLLEASNPSGISPICVYVIHMIELLRGATPVFAPYKNRNQEKRIRLSSTDHIMRAFSNYSGNTNGHVMMSPFRLVASYKGMHENICRLVEDQVIPLIIVPFHRRQRRLCHINLQEHGPCTIGILVDKGLYQSASLRRHSFRVAVLFLGGADDREALALAARMLGNPNLSITLIKINLKGREKEQNDYERLLDHMLLREFKSKGQQRIGFRYQKEAVEDTRQVFDAIRSLQNNYDLFIVGKHHAARWQLGEEILPWIEYPELGVIGDMITSPDFLGGEISVLVIQHCKDSSVDVENMRILEHNKNLACVLNL